jgi:hypothetical protein
MRRMHIPGFLLLLLLLVSACRPKYSPTPVWVAYNDFENVAGWMNNPTNNSHTVVRGEAYSGSYACRIHGASNFGFYYKNRLKDISDKKISWVKISGYCKAKSDRLNKASVVCNLEDDKGVLKSWEVAFLQRFTEGRKDKWIHFEKSFNINTFSQPDYFLGAMVWSQDTTDEVLIDDFKIEFFK